MPSGAGKGDGFATEAGGSMAGDPEAEGELDLLGAPVASPLPHENVIGAPTSLGSDGAFLVGDADAQVWMRHWPPLSLDGVQRVARLQQYAQLQMDASLHV